MLSYFDLAKNKILEKGEKVDQNKWVVDKCTFSIEQGVERIYVAGLINVVNKGGELTILEGSEDSLRFLSESI